MTTLTIMRALPREVDPVVYNMLHEDPGNVSYSAVGGLSDQIRELRESIELPLMNPELFIRVGIKPPKGVLLYGPHGTGKTLLARANASNIDANFLKVVSSAIIDKYIGESARLIREMFGYARDHQPCIIFMDEIDAIGGRRFSEGTSADREIQRTLMELLNQLNGVDQLGKVKMIMATNRPDVLDPALLRDYVIHEDFMKDVRKLNEAKKLESSAHYNSARSLLRLSASLWASAILPKSFPSKVTGGGIEDSTDFLFLPCDMFLALSFRADLSKLEIVSKWEDTSRHHSRFGDLSESWINALWADLKGFGLRLIE
ncbi:26S proteasome regulatory subunit S10B homolog B-like [Mercurialis annua]|uniref:26S proteasome regulatory subunit S10B homolog B-like n=1 Tax=Mercurialis annua TaxID=3986 RepID=UPI0024ACAF47|nr:26S proteasome regulatory subunit S10B homolog B-like [Mercurialis annua]